MPDVPSSDLPTEVGMYLFYGVSDVERMDARDLHDRGPRAQLIRVARDATGRLVYVGSDIFWHPSNARGLWLRMDGTIDTMRPTVDDVVLDDVARRRVPAACAVSASGQPRSVVISRLAGPYHGVAATAERMFDRAVALGVIVEVPDGSYKGWWRLPETK